MHKRPQGCAQTQKSNVSVPFSPKEGWPKEAMWGLDPPCPPGGGLLQEGELPSSHRWGGGDRTGPQGGTAGC